MICMNCTGKNNVAENSTSSVLALTRKHDQFYTTLSYSTLSWAVARSLLRDVRSAKLIKFRKGRALSQLVQSGHVLAELITWPLAYWLRHSILLEVNKSCKTTYNVLRIWLWTPDRPLYTIKPIERLTGRLKMINLMPNISVRQD